VPCDCVYYTHVGFAQDEGLQHHIIVPTVNDVSFHTKCEHVDNTNIIHHRMEV